MIKTILSSFAILVFIAAGYTQNQKPSFASNSLVPFDKFISGVKYAEIGLNAMNQEQVDNQKGIAGFYYTAQKYLQQIGFEYVALTSAEKTQLEIGVKSYCEFALVMFGGDINKNSISNMTISFISCNGDIYSFTSDKKFMYRRFTDVEKKLIEDWKSFVKTRGNYNRLNQFKLPSNPTAWTKERILKYFEENKGNLAPIEGIYERVRLSFEDITGGKYSVGVIKNPKAEGYVMIYLSGAKNTGDWQSGELKAVLNGTATGGFYTVDWISRDKSLYEDVYCNLDPLGLSVYSSGVFNIAYKFIKIQPKTN